MVIPLRFDHLAIGADSLRQGTVWAGEMLGVDMPVGGCHLAMGTHNLVGAMGPDSYLEIIAIDPELNAPARRRWFNLDDPDQASALVRLPRPLTWVARTTDIEFTLAAAQAVGADLGRVVRMERGDLRWLITVRDDGTLPGAGLLPTVIQWLDDPHPAGRMGDIGVRLTKVRLIHPDPERLEQQLAAMGIPADLPLSIEMGEHARIGAELWSPGRGSVTV